MNIGFKIIQFFLFFLLAIAGGILFYFFSTDKGVSPDSLEQDSGFGEDILIEGVRHFELKAESILWSVDAKEARFFQTNNIVQFDDIKVSFYPSAGGEMILIAKKGYYETDTRNMCAEGGVVGISDQGYEFWTQNLRYEAATKDIYSADKVTLRKGRLTIEGVGLKGSLDTRTIQILSFVKAVFLFN